MRRLLLSILLLRAACIAQDAPATPPPASDQPAHPEVLHIPARAYPLALLKSRLANLLIASLRDEGRGIVDAKREREIRTLMIKIQTWVPAE